LVPLWASPMEPKSAWPKGRQSVRQSVATLAPHSETLLAAPTVLQSAEP
jgi:hypothetical protein